MKTGIFISTQNSYYAGKAEHFYEKCAYVVMKTSIIADLIFIF